MVEKKIDYKVLVEPGTFGDGFSCYRVSVVNGKKRVNQFNEAKINAGFGVDPQRTVDDFIRRNDSEVLDMVFDL